MIVEEYWKVNLKNGIFGGLKPTKDPFDNAAFYIGDGAGSPYPSMKLRKLSLSDGIELTNTPIKNSIRCIHIDKNIIFLASDKKLFEINRTDLNIKKIFQNGMPIYSDYINTNNSGIILLMNHRGSFLNVFNYITGQSSKKKIKSCRGIKQKDNNNFLIYSAYDGVYNYNISNNKLEKILTIEPYYECSINKSETMFIHCGKITGENTIDEHIEPLSKIKIYKSPVENEFNEIIIEKEFRRVIVSEDETLLYLINKNNVYIYSLEDEKIIDEYIFETDMMVGNIFDNEKLIFTFGFNKKILKCWKYK
jgi:outer membrane protein assembly factor BamB